MNGRSRKPEQPALFDDLRKQSAGHRAKPGTPTPPTLPAWLKQQIENQNPAAFGKYAHWKICPRCNAVTLEGWDAYYDYAGHVVVDPLELDTMQELFAHITDRRTFELRTDSDGRKTISTRDSHRILASPATAHSWPVVADHRCFEPIGSKLEPRKKNGK